MKGSGLRWVLDELVIDVKIGEWNRMTEPDEERTFRRKVREAREITVTRANTLRFLRSHFTEKQIRKAWQGFRRMGRGKTQWYRNPRPEWK